MSIYTHRRVAPLLTLGFASGLPLALTSGTLQAWATVEGVSLQTLGLLTLAGSAYTLKFLWAPLMDRYAPAILGRRRGWMLLMQALMAVGIFAMAAFAPATQLGWLAICAVLVAFFSASFDIAFDAYRSDSLRPEERGAGAALSVLGYRAAMLVSGGLALVLAERYLGWSGMYRLMAGLAALSMLATLLAPEPERAGRAPATLRDAISAPLQQFFTRPGSWALLSLIVLYKLGDAFAGSLSTAFLIRGAGFSATEVGLINKGVGLVATIIGALLGGAWLARWGLYRSLMGFGLLQALSNLGFFAVALMPRELGWMALAVGLENLCGGLGTAAFVALLMGLCDARFSATQFALLSALAVIGRTYLAGPAAPWLVEQLGWPGFFGLTVLIALPGLLVLRLMRARISALDQPAVVADADATSESASPLK